jgi:hypothetical protein
MPKASVLAAAFLALLFLAAPAAAAPFGGGADEDAIVVVNGDVEVERGTVVDGVFVVSGDVLIAGRVDGDVVVLAGNVLLGGRVDGNLVATSGRTRLLPRARIGGDLIHGEERPLLAPTAVVRGEVEEVTWEDAFGLPLLIGALVFWLAVSISAAILGVLLLLIAPRAADAAFEQAETRFWTAVGIGAGIFVALPLIALLAAILVVGLPLAIGIGLALLPLAAVAYVTAAWALGRTLVKPPSDPILAFLAGLAILRAAALVPVLGLLVGLGAVIAGLGLLGAAIAAARPGPAR